MKRVPKGTDKSGKRSAAKPSTSTRAAGGAGRRSNGSDGKVPGGTDVHARGKVPGGTD